MRFDDSLATVLAADPGPGVGARSTWRQLVDLIGRRRVAADPAMIDRLRALRGAVPVEVRAASARALAFANPPAALVALFAEESIAVAAPVLRTAVLDDGEWTGLLPRLDAQGRSVLRHRRDLSAAIVRALASFGPADFVLGHDAPAAPEVVAPAPEPAPVAEPAAITPPAGTPLDETPFVTLGAIAGALPVVAEARRRAEAAKAATPAEAPRFEIADLIARIDGFQRERPEPVDATPAIASVFQFECDPAGTIRWVEGVARAALIGLAPAELRAAARTRERAQDVTLTVTGDSAAAGRWRLFAVPRFDRDGRFAGLRGTARRLPDAPAGGVDSLRQLVHELRTPANAIMGFAELIDTELLGPVAPVYRERAGAIRGEAGDLVAAIDDLDTAARIAGRALELRAEQVAPVPLLTRIAADLAPGLTARGVTLGLATDDLPPIAADARQVERLVLRLVEAVTAAAQTGEQLTLSANFTGSAIVIAIDRPAALPLDGAIAAPGMVGGPLLGIDFTLRLVRNLAAALGGSMLRDAARLTLRLPAAVNQGVQAAAI